VNSGACEEKIVPTEILKVNSDACEEKIVPTEILKVNSGACEEKIVPTEILKVNSGACEEKIVPVSFKTTQNCFSNYYHLGAVTSASPLTWFIIYIFI
jgi:hypothetical protein